MELKKLLVIPVSLVCFSLLILMNNYLKTGDPILKDVDLKGGTLITIESKNPIDVNKLEEELTKVFSSVSVSGLVTPNGYGALIEVERIEAEKVINLVRSLGIPVTSYSVETIGPELGNLFFTQVIQLLVSAYVLMSIVIYLIYRNLTSSIGIVFASVANIVTTLALTSLFGIKISFAGFAGLLMLIAYTVDTNIVLTSKVLGARKFFQQYKKALKTGIMLTATVTTAMVLVQIFSTSRLLTNIAQILVIGFLNDLAYTWIFNASILEIKR